MSCGTILTERAYLSVHVPFLQLARMRSGREPYSVFFQLTIQNVSTVLVQLLGRKWTIHEGNDTLRIIEGEHVFGVDPVLAPGACLATADACASQNVRGRWNCVFLDMMKRLHALYLPRVRFRYRI